jgi:small GTP-binding protein
MKDKKTKKDVIPTTNLEDSLKHGFIEDYEGKNFIYRRHLNPYDTTRLFIEDIESLKQPGSLISKYSLDEIFENVYLKSIIIKEVGLLKKIRNLKPDIFLKHYLNKIEELEKDIKFQEALLKRDYQRYQGIPKFKESLIGILMKQLINKLHLYFEKSEGKNENEIIDVWNKFKEFGRRNKLVFKIEVFDLINEIKSCREKIDQLMENPDKFIIEQRQEAEEELAILRNTDIRGPYDYLFKIVVLGENGVGRRTLLEQYCGKEISFSEEKTNVSNLYLKEIMIERSRVRLAFSNERINTWWLKYSKTILLIYDITSERSIEKIPEWITTIRELNKLEDIPILLVGNKLDLENRKVTKAQALELKEKYGLSEFFEVSALRGDNVEEMFNTLATIISQILKKLQTDQKKVNSSPPWSFFLLH